MKQSTTDRILKALEPYELKREGERQYRCNRPWSRGSDSLGLSLTIDDPEHGAWYDHVADEGGSLYELAERLGIQTDNGREPAEETSAAYNDLVAYAHAHGVDAEVFRAAGWKEERYPYDGRDRLRRAIRFPTKNGDRWRFLDGQKPKFKSPKDYKTCWYGLARAVEIANRSNQPLVICNGEPSVVAAQHWGIAACAITSGEKRDIPVDLFDELKSTWSGEIFIAPDCDDTGEKMATGLMARLQGAGYQVGTVDLNGSRGFDLADFCALNKEASIQKLQALKLVGVGSQEEETPPPNPSSARYTIRDAAYALQPQPPVDYLIKHIIRPGSINLIVGDAGKYKTFIVIHLGVCVALGKSWLDFTTKRARVLIIDEENGDETMARRLGDVLRGEFADDETPIEYVSMARFNLRDPGEAVLLHALIEERGAKLVIIDSLMDIMPEADENSVKDVNPVFMALKKITEETGTAFLNIHHLNKGGSYRGSTAIKGYVDLMLLVDTSGKEINFSSDKARHEESSRFAAVIHFNDDQVWLTPANPTERPKALGKGQEYVIRYLAGHGATLLTELMSRADTCSPNTARSSVYALTNDGNTARVDDGGVGERAAYDLTDKGRELAVQLGYSEPDR